MTENEAKQWLKHTRAYQHKCDNCEYIDIKGTCNEECKDFYDMAIQALEKVQKFEAIGTIEEFKALKEKSVAKKPILNNPKINEFYVKEAKLCPVCHSYINNYSGDYCRDCGQKLDWSE